MPTRNVNLTDHFDRFVEANVHSGQYQNASEVVREGLNLREAVEIGDAAFERGDYRDIEAGDLGDYLAGLGKTARRRTPLGQANLF